MGPYRVKRYSGGRDQFFFRLRDASSHDEPHLALDPVGEHGQLPVQLIHFGGEGLGQSDELIRNLVAVLQVAEESNQLVPVLNQGLVEGEHPVFNILGD